MDPITEIKLKSELSSEELIKRLENRGVKIDQEIFSNNYLSDALQNYLYLTYFPELINSPVDELSRFYSRYFWLLIFVEKYKRRIGEDAGLEQQVFKLLEEAEHSNLEVDWKLIEQIHQKGLNVVKN